MARGNRTAGEKRKGGRKSRWPGGTTWASVPLPCAVAEELHARGHNLPAVIIAELRLAIPDLPWPKEGGRGAPTSPAAGSEAEGGQDAE